MRGLANKIAWLENQLGKNSHNRSKPPTTDGFKRPKKIISNNRERTERKAGGPEGHQGHTLEFATKPAEIIKHQTSHCLVCGNQFTAEGVLDEQRQTIEIPPVLPRYIEHQAYDHHCCCGERTRTTSVGERNSYPAKFPTLACWLFSLVPPSVNGYFFSSMG